MSEIAKTTTFVVVAACLAGLAGLSYYANRPGNSADFELVGKPFFPEFESATKARALEVAALDADTGDLRRFSVENQNGLWRIPSHYNYPAEAAARLAETATSVMGVQREALAGRLASEHERLGVIDPLGDAVEDPEAAGKRITLKDESGEVLVDLIIGKQVEEDPVEQPDTDFEAIRSEPVTSYYVRRPDEQQTYKVQLNIDLSTRFSDWIDPDLLRVEPNRLTQVSINNYTLEEQPGTNGVTLLKSQGDQLNLTRASGMDPWNLEGIDEATEQVDAARISQIVGVLDEMKIADVRPKFKYLDHLLLTPDLKLNQQPEFLENPEGLRQAINRMQMELDDRGFNLAGTSAAMELASQNGELTLGTDQGVVYTLHIGKPVEETEKEIEIGTAAQEGDSQDESATPASENEATDGTAAVNRYLMVRVSFDENLVADRPQKPVEPVEPMKPEGYVPPPAESTAEPPAGDGGAAAPKEASPAAESDEGEAAPAPPAQEAGGCQEEGSTQEPDPAPETQEPAGEPGPPPAQEGDPAPAPQEPTRKPEFEAYDQALADYQQKKTQYDLDLLKYEDDLKAFEERAAEGRQLVEELNQRFGDWYYVISAENLQLLQSTREDLVRPRETPAAPAGGSEIPMPNIPGLELPQRRPAQPPAESSAPNSNPGQANPDGAAPTEPTSGTENAGEAQPAETAGQADPATSEKSASTESDPAPDEKSESTESVPPSQPGSGGGTAKENAPTSDQPVEKESGDSDSSVGQGQAA